ncbi:MAG: hypothetical protein GY719_01315 [bacterium]|nr:hypothetical protein [bacterium]
MNQRSMARGVLAACLMAAAALSAHLARADFPKGPMVLVSTKPGDANGRTGHSLDPSVSHDGRYVAFSSSARDLIPTDDNNHSDIFVKDLRTGEIEIVSSYSPIESTANGQSLAPAISGTGRYVVFNSDASNLGGGNGVCQTFFIDRGNLDLPMQLRQRLGPFAVSVIDRLSAVGNGGCPDFETRPSVSDNGRWAGFTSTSNNLVDDDLHNDNIYAKVHQVFVRDIDHEKTYRLTDDPTIDENESPDENSGEVRMSADGKIVVFASAATNFPFADASTDVDLYVWGDDGIQRTLIGRIDANKTDLQGENMHDVSRDGEWVAFWTAARLDPDEDLDSAGDVYVTRTLGNQNELVSGTVSGWSGDPSISANGRFVAFYPTSYRPNVYVHDRETGSTHGVLAQPNGDPGWGSDPSLSGDGRTLAVASRVSLVPEESGEPWVDVFARVGAFDVLDPHPLLVPDLAAGSAPAPSFAAVLAALPQTGGQEMTTARGVAADGETRVLLRLVPTQPTAGPVTFRIRDENGLPDEVGTLHQAAFPEPPGGQDLDVGLLPVPSLGAAAFAIWKAPERFVRDRLPVVPGGQDPCEQSPDHDECVGERSVRLEVSFPIEGGVETLSRTLVIARPPVSLVHGIWSSRDTWKEWSLADDSRFTVDRFDYESSNAAPFAVNRFRMRRAMQDALRPLREDAIAATQVDVIGHSMGGVVSRLFALQPNVYWRNDNFLAGDIHSLVTLGTPHEGSPMACKLIGLTNVPFFGWIIEKAVDKGIGCVGCGAIHDLRPGSPWLADVAETSVPAHALVGTGGSEFLAGEGRLSTLLFFVRVARFIVQATVDSFFLPDTEHDVLVGQTSQEGGLVCGETATAHDYLSPDEPAWHLSETKESRFDQSAIDLLQTEAGNTVRLAPAFPNTTSAPCGQGPAVSVGEIVTGGLVITSPAPGATASPGDSLKVKVAAIGGRTLDRVLFFSRIGVTVDETPPFKASWEIPAEEVGELRISAVAFDEAGDLLVADDASIGIDVASALVAIRVEPDPLVLDSLAPSAQLRVIGGYDDGYQRDLTSPLSGTTYSSLDPAVAAVDAGGRVTAGGRGRTVIVARNGAFSGDADVRVEGLGPFLELPSPGAAGTVNRFRVYGLTAGGGARVFQGSGYGTSSLPGCSESLGIEAAVELGSGSADAGGVALIEAAVPITDAGVSVVFQAVDDTTCSISAPLPFQYAEPGDPPQIVSQPDPVIEARTGDTVELRVLVAAQGEVRFQWQIGLTSPVDLQDGPGVTGAGTGTLTLSRVNGGDLGHYRCVVTGDYGTETSDPSELKLVTVSAVLRDSFSSGVPGDPMLWRLAEVGDVAWGRSDLMAISAGGAATIQDGGTSGRAYLPFDPDRWGLIVELAADLDPEGSSWAGIGFASSDTTSLGGGGQFWAQLKPNGVFQIRGDGLEMLVSGPAPVFHAGDFNRLVLRYDPLTRRGSARINGEEVLAETPLSFVADIRYVGMQTNSATANLTAIDNFELGIEPAVIRDTFTGAAAGDPVLGRPIEVGDVAWGVGDLMAISAGGSVTIQDGVTSGRAHLPFDPGLYGLVMELAANLKPEGATWAGIGFTRHTSGMGGGGQFWAQLKPSGVFQIRGDGLEMLASGPAPVFHAGGFNRLVLRYDPLTRRGSVRINGEEVFAEAPLSFVPDIQYVGMQTNSATPEVTEIDDFELRLEPTAIRDTFAGAVAGEPVFGRSAEVGEVAWGPADLMAISIGGSATIKDGVTSGRAHLPFDPDRQGLIVELAADLKPEGSTWAGIGFTRHTSGMGGGGQFWAQLKPNGVFQIRGDGLDMLARGPAPVFHAGGFNRLVLRYDPLTRRGSVRINGEEVFAEAALPFVPDIQYVGMQTNNATPDLTEIDDFEVGFSVW